MVFSLIFVEFQIFMVGTIVINRKNMWSKRPEIWDFSLIFAESQIFEKKSKYVLFPHICRIVNFDNYCPLCGLYFVRNSYSVSLKRDMIRFLFPFRPFFGKCRPVALVLWTLYPVPFRSVPRNFCFVPFLGNLVPSFFMKLRFYHCTELVVGEIVLWIFSISFPSFGWAETWSELHCTWG